MKKLIIFLIFLSGHFLSKSQTFVEEGTKDTITISQSVRTRTVIDTAVTVTRKKYNPPPVIVQPPTQPPAEAGYKLVYQNNFDKLSDLTTNNGQYGNGTVVNGTFYSRPANVSSGTRSELQISSAVTPSEGAAEWDAKYEVIVRNNGHSWQIHPQTSGGSASPGLWHIGGKFVLMNWTKDRGNIEYPTGVTIPQNVWNTYRIEWKYGTSGYLKFYMDGKLIMSKTGRVNDGSGGYLKFGWNGWGSDASQSRIYIDNIRVYEKVNEVIRAGVDYYHIDNIRVYEKVNDSLYFSGQTINPIEQWKLRINSPNISCAVDHGDKPCPGYPNPAPVPSRIDTVPPAKTYQLELTESEANTLLYILNKGKLDGMSGEDATLVAILIQRVTGQLRKQATGNK